MRHFLKRIELKDMIERRNDKARRAQQFIGTIRSELKRCVFYHNSFGNFEELQVLRNGRLIGFVVGNDFLLDSNYIFNKMVMKYGVEDEYLFDMDKKSYFSDFLRSGIIKPYSLGQRYYKAGEEYLDVICFRISNSVINFDIRNKLTYEV